VAFLCGFGAQAQITVFKYSDGPLIPPHVRQIYLTNNTWDIGKNYYGEAAILGDVKATLPILNALLVRNPPAGAAQRNEHLRQLDAERRRQWNDYHAQALRAPEIWAVVIAEALRMAIQERSLQKQFVYVHEAVSDPAPFQYLLPLGICSSGAKRLGGWVRRRGGARRQRLFDRSVSARPDQQTHGPLWR
jgi:benzoylformate decarboxylase